MVSALGYIAEQFNPASPGRLCRGRERWIEYETMEEDLGERSLHRIILSGATFSDDRARDARRGIGFGPIGYYTLLTQLLGDGMLVAYCEEGHPHEVPENGAGVEHHTVARPGGSLREWRVRWHTQIENEDQLQAAIAAGADVFFTIDSPTAEPASTVHESPLIPPVADEASSLPSFVNEGFASALFLLTGFRSEGRPNRYFQPWGVPAVLDHIQSVALIHRDKHGPALGVYANTAFDLDGLKAALEEKADKPLLVPFAIPPMLARWDRALSELRQLWDEPSLGPFPVPAAEVPPEEQEPVAAETEPVDVEEAPVAEDFSAPEDTAELSETANEE